MAKKLSRNIQPRAESTAHERQLKEPKSDGPSGYIPSGEHTINPKLSGVCLTRFGSVWSAKNSSASFRIWNHLNEKDPASSLLCGRLGPRMDELGGMSMYGPAVVAPFVGIGPRDSSIIPNPTGKKSTFIITKSAPQVRSLKWKKNVTDVLKEGVKFWELPYPAFYDACKNAFRAGAFANGGPRWNPEWNPLMTGSDGMSPIPDMKQRYFVVGHFYELGPDLNTQQQVIKTWDGKQEQEAIIDRKGIPYGLGENDPLVVAWMPGAAGEKVLELCKAMKDTFEGDEDANPALPYKYGDPCGIHNAETGEVKGGLIFTMFNPSVTQPSSNANSTWNGVVPDAGEISSYQVSVSRSYTATDGTKYVGDMTADEAQQIFNKNCYAWAQDGDSDDSTLLHESSILEECVRIAEGFVDVPKLVEFAWTSHPEYLDFDEVKAILNKRTVVSMPEAAFEDEEPGTGMYETLEEVGVASATDGEFDDKPEEVGGEIEVEDTSPEKTVGVDDDEFDEFAQTFAAPEKFEEDEEDSSEFDPEAEAEELSDAMDDTLQKASKALANSAKRKSPRRKLPRD
jgi:hypothetical protein